MLVVPLPWLTFCHCAFCWTMIYPRAPSQLVGGFKPFWKILRKIGSFPQVGVKINNVWNHHSIKGRLLNHLIQPKKKQIQETLASKLNRIFPAFKSRMNLHVVVKILHGLQQTKNPCHWQQPSEAEVFGCKTNLGEGSCRIGAESKLNPSKTNTYLACSDKINIWGRPAVAVHFFKQFILEESFNYLFIAMCVSHCKANFHGQSESNRLAMKKKFVTRVA